MDCSTPGFPVHHQLLELTQTHVHWVGDAIQPSHPLSSPFPPAFNLSQHQGCCFSSSHVWLWESDYKESWVLKNRCFWTVVLEKTLESPLNCREIQPVHPKRDQSWVFIGRTDVEVETPILWPPDVKSWLRKDPDAGKDWRQEEKGTTEDKIIGWHHRLNGHEFGWTPGVAMDREAWRAVVHGVTKSRTGWATELNCWASQGKNTEVVCHCLLQWTMFYQNSPPWPICLRWTYRTWVIVSLSWTRLWSMWSVWLVFCDCGFHSFCRLMDKDKRFMEASWWERLTEGETGSRSGERGHTQ